MAITVTTRKAFLQLYYSCIIVDSMSMCTQISITYMQVPRYYYLSSTYDCADVCSLARAIVGQMYAPSRTRSFRRSRTAVVP